MDFGFRHINLPNYRWIYTRGFAIERKGFMQSVLVDRWRHAKKKDHRFTYYVIYAIDFIQISWRGIFDLAIDRKDKNERSGKIFQFWGRWRIAYWQLIFWRIIETYYLISYLLGFFSKLRYARPKSRVKGKEDYYIFSSYSVDFQKFQVDLKIFFV